MSVPFLDRKNQHRVGRSGRRSEKRLVRELNGKARPGSGAVEGAKGDIDLGAVLMEAKSTTADSMSIKLGWLCKIAAEARSTGRTPALSVSFVLEGGEARRDGEWVMIPRHQWEQLK